jgi:hypothetical protein
MTHQRKHTTEEIQSLDLPQLCHCTKTNKPSPRRKAHPRGASFSKRRSSEVFLHSPRRNKADYLLELYWHQGDLSLFRWAVRGSLTTTKSISIHQLTV